MMMIHLQGKGQVATRRAAFGDDDDDDDEDGGGDDDETFLGQRSIQRVGHVQKKTRCVQAPRVETTQGLPLGHWGRSI